ncbi:replication stress response regulator SDE2 isoform X2 [Mugil cephalus]|uniref:replication stress response regulator SDE2 isoform X2 n=1 Tax=Mugil cephalus TaxID=48193 RepID=UPI001FB7DC5B|nr:replication stress response regulator SDE2 isoform X2 [Mugil cephalus]
MEVFVCAPGYRFTNQAFRVGSSVRDVLDFFVQHQRASAEDFYVIRNGRLSHLEDPLQHGAIYHLEPRLCGGKGGFGSMLRALGAQIEKTTNREACRDLSGRRLRDVNHEKEMAEWLKKQAEREAEKEQRRLERLQRKLAEPKHQFTDPEYQRQCHDLSERLEDSVLKGLQASSSAQVKAGDVSSTKRPNNDQSSVPPKKKKTTVMEAAAAPGFWTGMEDLEEELLSSESEDTDDEDSPTMSSSVRGAVVTTAKLREGAEQSGSSTSSGLVIKPQQTSGAQRKDQEPPQTSGVEREDQEPPQTSGVEREDQEPPQTSGAKREDQEPPQTSGAKREDQEPPQTSGAKREDQEPPQTSKPSESNCSSRQLDLSSVSSVLQLESLGLDVLKEELMSRGLKCGGTLSERAARLFSVRGLSPDQIDPALLAKPAKSRKNVGSFSEQQGMMGR